MLGEAATEDQKRRRKRRNHSASFKAKAAVAAVRGGEKTLAEVSGVVLRPIEEHGLGESIVVAPGPNGVQWSNRLAVERRAARGSNRLSMTGASAGTAETGSVMLPSGSESPTTLNFLPEAHIVVLRESRIIPHFEGVHGQPAAARRRGAGMTGPPLP